MFAAVIVAPASAQTAESGTELSINRHSKRLDELFSELARQSDEKAAERTAKRIWALWGQSGSASIDLLMDRASIAMKSRNNPAALDLLDQVVTLAPGYAEGWNRRATLYFTMKQFGRSIGDVEQVLALEPRHFGALSGLAIMLQALGKDQKALETWYRVLAIYPASQQAQTQVIKLIEKLDGKPT